MSTFLFVYRHHKDRTPTRSPETAAAWGAFFSGIGPHLEDMGNPVRTGAVVGECGENTVLWGYSLVSADSMEEALTLAERCPTLQRGGGVEVGEVARLNPDALATTIADHTSASSAAD